MIFFTEVKKRWQQCVRILSLICVHNFRVLSKLGKQIFDNLKSKGYESVRNEKFEKHWIQSEIMYSLIKCFKVLYLATTGSMPLTQKPTSVFSEKIILFLSFLSHIWNKKKMAMFWNIYDRTLRLDLTVHIWTKYAGNVVTLHRL